MAIGDTVKAGLKLLGLLGSAPGSVQADWHIANTDLSATAQTAGQLLNPASVTASQVRPVTIPPGATRALVRLRIDDGCSGNGTPAVVVLMGVDASGVPVRLDNVDQNATGITLTWTSGDATDGTYDYSDLPNLTGYDMLGCKTLYVLVATAGVYTGATDPTAMVLFLN